MKINWHLKDQKHESESIFESDDQDWTLKEQTHFHSSFRKETFVSPRRLWLNIFNDGQSSRAFSLRLC